MSSNIPAVPSYGIYISQLVRICSTYDEFVKRNMVITSRLIKQGFLYTKLVTSFKKFMLNISILWENIMCVLKTIFLME